MGWKSFCLANCTTRSAMDFTCRSELPEAMTTTSVMSVRCRTSMTLTLTAFMSSSAELTMRRRVCGSGDPFLILPGLGLAGLVLSDWALLKFCLAGFWAVFLERAPRDRVFVAIAPREFISQAEHSTRNPG